MNSLDTLTQLKESISSAKYCACTEEYKGMAIEAELDRIEFLVDKLIKERTDDDEFLAQGFPLQGEGSDA